MRVVATTSLLALIAVACTTTPPPALPQATTTAGAAAATAVVAHAATVPVDHRFVALSDGQLGRILLVDLTKGTSTEVVTARGSPRPPVCWICLAGRPGYGSSSVKNARTPVRSCGSPTATGYG